VFPTQIEPVLVLALFLNPTETLRSDDARFPIPTAVELIPIVPAAAFVPVITPVASAMFANVVWFIIPHAKLEYALVKFVLPIATD
jgi:hypothetical protein